MKISRAYNMNDKFQLVKKYLYVDEVASYSWRSNNQLQIAN